MDDRTIDPEEQEILDRSVEEYPTDPDTDESLAKLEAQQAAARRARLLREAGRRKTTEG